MHFLLFVIAIIAYIAAPFEYNQSYCIFLTCFFILQAVIVLKEDIISKQKEKISFTDIKKGISSSK